MDSALLILVTGISVGALYFLLASGLALIFGLMSFLSFAHGAFLTLAAYGLWTVFDVASRGSSTWVLAGGLLAAVLVGGAISYLTERVLIRPLYTRDHLDQLLVTMGLSFVLVGVLKGVWGPDDRSLSLPGWVTDTTNIGDALIPNDRILIIGLTLLMYVLIELFLNRTRHGLIVRAGVENREMVQALGIDVRTSFTLIFVIAGLAAGLAGALSGVYSRSVGPHIGDRLLLFAFIVLVVGGLGSFKGALVAALVIGTLQQFANFYIDAGVGDVLAVVLLAVVLLVRPQGLFGTKGRLV
jgi:branched-chain amino acid transport system permease protein